MNIRSKNIVIRRRNTMKRLTCLWLILAMIVLSACRAPMHKIHVETLDSSPRKEVFESEWSAWSKETKRGMFPFADVFSDNDIGDFAVSKAEDYSEKSWYDKQWESTDGVILTSNEKIDADARLLLLRYDGRLAWMQSEEDEDNEGITNTVTRGDGIVLTKNMDAEYENAYYTDSKRYDVQDILVSGDKVYISCMATNISDDEYWEGFREIWLPSSDASNWETHINLLQLYHSRFSAALLCCDSGGTVSDVWFVDKVMAGKLTEKDGMISTDSTYRHGGAANIFDVFQLYLYKRYRICIWF